MSFDYVFGGTTNGPQDDHISVDEAWGLFDADGSVDGPLQIQASDDFRWSQPNLDVWSDVDAWRHVALVAPVEPASYERRAFVELCAEPDAVGEIDRVINAAIGAPIRREWVR